MMILNSYCKQIRTIERNVDIPHEGAFCDRVWSDPEEIEAWAVSSRGAGYMFGHKVVAAFNHMNGLQLICRAHQLVQEGLKYMFPGDTIVTVWSAPNYCYRCGNVASILTFDDKLEKSITYFEGELVTYAESQIIICKPHCKETPLFFSIVYAASMIKSDRLSTHGDSGSHPPALLWVLVVLSVLYSYHAAVPESQLNVPAPITTPYFL